MVAPAGNGAIKQAAAPDLRQTLLGANKSMTALRVLIVEDEAVLAMLYEDVLVAMGHEVCAIEATELGAVAATVRCRPDLMIVDAHLRDGSGVSAVSAILRAGYIPHVFVSGDSLRESAAARSRCRRPAEAVSRFRTRSGDRARARRHRGA